MVTLLLVVKSNICLRKADDMKERSAFHKIYEFEHRLHVKLQALLAFVSIWFCAMLDSVTVLSTLFSMSYSDDAALSDYVRWILWLSGVQTLDPIPG